MPSQTVGHALQDPNIRAERFVERRQERQGQRQQLRGWQHDEARGELESQMAGLTKSLERDPQERNQQDWWLVGVGALPFSAAPRAASIVMGDTPWRAGRALIESVSPKDWKTLETGG
jgi:hypothetical protein